MHLPVRVTVGMCVLAHSQAHTRSRVCICAYAQAFDEEEEPRKKAAPERAAPKKAAPKGGKKDDADDEVSERGR